jgi:hypothetical protein
MGKTVETVTMKVKPGVSKEEFLAKNWDVEDNLVRKMPGLISRDTAMDRDGNILIVLYWESPEDAQKSMDKFVGAPESQDFQAILDMDTFKMTRYEVQSR